MLTCILGDPGAVCRAVRKGASYGTKLRNIIVTDIRIYVHFIYLEFIYLVYTFYIFRSEFMYILYI